MSRIWFTSDTHFSHKNIVLACSDWPNKATACRDFPSVADHDAYLIEQINKRVRACDTLYHLGDFGLGFAWRERFKEVRAAIACESVYLILGNHDHIFSMKNKDAAEYRALFKDVRELSYKKLSNRLFVMCHYSMRTWPWQNQNSIMLYGHSHGHLADNLDALSMDIGVDTNLFGHERYTPYSLDEVVHIMDTKKKFVPVDHHKPETEG